MKKILIAVFSLLVLAGAFLACGGTDTASSTANTSTLSTNTPSSTQAPSQKHYKVGDHVKVGDTWEITVNNVKTLASDGDYNKPDSGKVFLIINVTVKNISNTEQTISSLVNFDVKDSSGEKAKVAFVTSASEAPDGKVEAGDVLKGDLTYQVPKSERQFILSFQADIMSSGQTLWDLKV